MQGVLHYPLYDINFDEVSPMRTYNMVTNAYFIVRSNNIRGLIANDKYIFAYCRSDSQWGYVNLMQIH